MALFVYIPFHFVSYVKSKVAQNQNRKNYLCNFTYKKDLENFEVFQSVSIETIESIKTRD